MSGGYKLIYPTSAASTSAYQKFYVASKRLREDVLIAEWEQLS